MTDQTPWQPPAGADAPPVPPAFPPPAPAPPATPGYYAPPVPPAPGYAPPVQGYAPPAPGYGPPSFGYAPPQYAPPGAPYGVPPGYPQANVGWTPPPKPGLIPLRPLTLGMILGASFQVLRRNPRPTFGLSLLISGVTSLLGILGVGFFTVFAASRTANAVGADVETLEAGSVGIMLLSLLVPVSLAVVGVALLQGIIALEVARGTLGEKLTLRGLFRSARGRLLVLVGWSFLLIGVVVVVYFVILLIIVAATAFGGVAGAVGGLIFGIVAFLGAFVGAAWIGTRIAFVPSVLMLERLTLREAVVRSWTLSRGFFWRTFGILLLVSVILGAISSIISTPFQLVASFGMILVNPNGSVEEFAGFMIGILIVMFAITAIFGAITAVVQSATSALLYLDLRMRKEGLDLELTRFVEARQAGDVTVENPYLAAQTFGVAPNAPR